MNPIDGVGVDKALFPFFCCFNKVNLVGFSLLIYLDSIFYNFDGGMQTSSVT